MRWAHRNRPVGARRLEALTGRTRAAPAPTIAVLVYRGVSTAEIDLPVTVLADRLSASVQFVGTAPGVLPGVEPSRDVVVDVVASDAGMPDWLVVPGGLGWRRVIDDRATMAWLAAAGAQARCPRHLDGQSAPGLGRAARRSRRGGSLAGDRRPGTSRCARRRERIAEAGRIMTASGALPAAQVAAAFADKVSWSHDPWSCPA